MEVQGLKTWKELTTGVQQLVRLLLTMILSTPDLSFNSQNGRLGRLGSSSEASAPIWGCFGRLRRDLCFALLNPKPNILRMLVLN